MGKVAVLESDTTAHTEIALGVCAFEFECHSHFLGGGEEYVGFEQFCVAVVSDRACQDVYVAQDGKAV